MSATPTATTPLVELERYAWRQAHRMVHPASDRDDAVQEALLAAWRTGDARTRYLEGVAYKRVADFATTRRHSGSEQPVGSKSVDVLRKRVWFDPWSAGLPDHEADQLFGSTVDHVAEDPVTVDRVRAAVAALPPGHRRNVFRRFWAGDLGSRSDQDQWRKTILPHLRKQFATL